MAQRIEEGDIVYVEYDSWVIHPDGKEELIDTTDEGKAKDNDLFDENTLYGPRPIIVGRGRVFQGFDESLKEAEIGVEKEVEVPPEKGAGERNPSLVELHSIREFRRREIEPEIGKEVLLRNKKGIITAVTAGRVRVDFNNPLAGRLLRYKFKVEKKVENVEEKVKAILRMDYGDPEQFQVDVEGSEATIVLPERCKVDEFWFVTKYRVVGDLREYAGMNKIRFVEEYVRAEETADEEE